MVPTVAGAPVPALLLPVNAPGEEAAIPALGSAMVASPGGRPACHARGKAELGLVPHDSLGAGRSLLPIFFFFRGAKPRAVPLAGGEISTGSFCLSSLALSCAWWPNFGGVSKVLEK